MARGTFVVYGKDQLYFCFLPLEGGRSKVGVKEIYKKLVSELASFNLIFLVSFVLTGKAADWRNGDFFVFNVILYTVYVIRFGLEDR